MKKSIMKLKDYNNDRLKNAKGITIIALVITIIVLLILAGVSLGLVFNGDGLFQKASAGASKYNQKQAEEVLITKLQEAQMEKYSQGLTDDRLNKMINEIGKVNESDNSLVTVGKYVFEIDRTVPKIIQFKEELDKTENDSPSSGGNTENDKLTNNIMVTLPLEDMTLRFGATEALSELNINEFNYSITPTEGLPKDKTTGTFKKNETVEITSTKVETYTIKVTAKDSTGNTVGIANVKMTTKFSLPAIGEAVPEAGWTVEQAKGLVKRDGLKAHLGEKVQYSPEQDETGVYRIFYYDNEVNSEDATKGYFGDPLGTLYLKRDYVSTSNTTLSSYTNYTPSDNGAVMKKMNPKWAVATNGSSIDVDNEHCVAWLCDPGQWEKYKVDNVANYVIGSPSVEMYMKAYGVYKETDGDTDRNSTALICKIGNTNGYSVGANNSYTSYNSNEFYTGENSVEVGPKNIFMSENGGYWLASPSGYTSAQLCIAYCQFKGIYTGSLPANNGVCPVVSISQ